MPPRKKARESALDASNPIVNENVVAILDTSQPGEPKKASYDILKDPWTDEQEISLFKGLIRWKPAGMHKHFRMIALSEHLRNHGYDPMVEKHTRIPGIWEKLRIGYNLPIIDERENPFESEDVDKYLEFKLPDEDFDEESLFERGRLHPSEAPSSPPHLGRSPLLQATRKRKRADTITRKNRGSTVDDTDEARTSPAPSLPMKSTRAGRIMNRLGARSKVESSSRAPSKDTTMDEDDGAEETEEAGEDDEEIEEQEGTPSPKASKTASKSKVNAPATRKSKRKK